MPQVHEYTKELRDWKDDRDYGFIYHHDKRYRINRSSISNAPKRGSLKGKTIRYLSTDILEDVRPVTDPATGKKEPRKLYFIMKAILRP